MKVSRHTKNAIYVSVGLLIVIFILSGFSQEQWVDVAGRKADDIIWRLSMTFAYTCLILLSITMSIGTVNLLLKRPNPTHNPSRRAFGVAAGFAGLAHLIFAITIHADGLDILPQFVRSTDSAIVPRIDRHGIANYAGLFQAGLLIALMMLSLNQAIKHLGLSRWKMLQRLVYFAFVSIALHGLIYQAIEVRSVIVRIVFLSIVLLVLCLQITGLFLRIRSRSINAESL